MNYSKIPRPGSNNGPCNFECAHVACDRMLTQANEHCALCGCLIGFIYDFCTRPEDVESPRPYTHCHCAATWAYEQRQEARRA